MRSLALYLCVCAALAQAGEYAVLSNGSRLRVDRHEIGDGKVRLYQGTGFIELDAAKVTTFDIVEEAAPIPTPTSVAAIPPPEPPATIENLADAAADRYGLPRPLIRSVIAAESAGQPSALSPKGAIGLMQLMPA